MHWEMVECLTIVGQDMYVLTLVTVVAAALMLVVVRCWYCCCGWKAVAVLL